MNLTKAITLWMNGNIYTFPHPRDGDRHHFEEVHLDDEENNDATDVDIWFHLFGVRELFAPNPIGAKRREKTIKKLCT